MGAHHLLLEVPSILFVNKYQIKIVANTEFLVHFPESGGEVEAAKEETYRNSFSCGYIWVSIIVVASHWRLAFHWCPIHNLELRDGFAFVVLVRR